MTQGLFFSSDCQGCRICKGTNVGHKYHRLTKSIVNFLRNELHKHFLEQPHY